MSIPNESNINARRLKSISTPADLNKRFFQVNLEPVERFMVEKIISLAITNSHHAKIREIPNYCFDKLKETIQNYTEIQYIAYDRDDLECSNENSYLYPRSVVDKDEKNFSIVSKIDSGNSI